MAIYKRYDMGEVPVELFKNSGCHITVFPLLFSIMTERTVAWNVLVVMYIKLRESDGIIHYLKNQA